MVFQKRMIFTYSLLILILVVILASLFFSYSSSIFEEYSLNTYRMLATHLNNQLDNILRPMDFVSTNMVSDASFKSALSTLEILDPGNIKNSFYLNEAEHVIQSQLYTYSIIENFYAAVVFDRNRFFYTSNFVEHLNVSYPEEALAKLPWTSSLVKAEGRSVTIAPFDDPWSPDSKNRLFGRGRIVPGLKGELSFLAILSREENLQSVFRVPDPEFVKVLVFLESGELLYSSDSAVSPSLSRYYQLHSAGLQQEGFSKNPYTHDLEAVSADKSSYSGATVLLVLNKKLLLAPLTFLRNITLAIGFLIVLVSITYNWISSSLLTKPLRLIQSKMEDTEISNLSSGDLLTNQNDEIVALDKAFMHLKERLDQSIHRELDSRTLWIKARFDSLQAQVNPHFINNILNVIAGRGLELGDKEIANICSAVASMLRYSNATSDASTTIQDELSYLETYLFLMKQRLEDMLEYSIEVDPFIYDAVLPKIVFHQIVENSLAHGYHKRSDRRIIRVTGACEGSYWRVVFTDNGDGFDPDKLKTLNRKIKSVYEDDEPGILKQGMDLGGLGLINTFARLFLFYKGDLIWDIHNLDSGGVSVTLGGPMDFNNLEKADV